MYRRIVTVMMLAGVLGLAACASKPPKPIPQSQSATGAGAGAESQGAGGENASGGPFGNQQSVPGPQQGILADRTIHFDFDSAVIKGHGIDIVAAHAKYLADHAAARVRLEGNTDERGSPEYNIGLGMRRAEAVRQAMLLQGASPNQITVVSYGAERPVDPAHDEAAWAKNRRVDIVYLTPLQPPGTNPAPGQPVQPGPPTQ